MQLSLRWDDFIECDAPLDLRGNETERNERGFGCTRVCCHTYLQKKIFDLSVSF